jgi:hypothetical protein
LVGWIGAWLSLISLGAAFGFVAQVINGQTPTWGLKLEWLNLDEVLRADSLSALLMVCVTAVAALALFLSPGLGPPIQNPHWGELAYRPNQLVTFHQPVHRRCCWPSQPTRRRDVDTIEAHRIFSFIIPLNSTKPPSKPREAIIGTRYICRHGALLTCPLSGNTQMPATIRQRALLHPKWCAWRSSADRLWTKAGISRCTPGRRLR